MWNSGNRLRSLVSMRARVRAQWPNFPTLSKNFESFSLYKPVKILSKYIKLSRTLLPCSNKQMTFLDTLKSYIKWKTINNLWTKFDHSGHRARANAIEFSLLTGQAGLLSRGLLFHISAHSALLTGKTLTFWGFNVRSQGQIHFWVGLLNVAALLVCSSLQGIFFTMGFESILKVSLHFN